MNLGRGLFYPFAFLLEGDSLIWGHGVYSVESLGVLKYFHPKYSCGSLQTQNIPWFCEWRVKPFTKRVKKLLFYCLTYSKTLGSFLWGTCQ